MHDEKVLTRFIRDVALHQLEVLREDGVYRHLRFKRPGTNAYYFDIVTWPGYLTVTGDMGTWTFSREHDMLRQFFPSDIAGGINPSYWSEKIESGTHGGRDAICFEFDEDDFMASLNRYIDEWREGLDEEDDASEIEDALSVRDSLFQEGFNNSSVAAHAVYNADWPRSIDTYDLAESINYSLNKFSFHFLWVCYAIVWGIGRYEMAKLTDGAIRTFIDCRYKL